MVERRITLEISSSPHHVRLAATAARSIVSTTSLPESDVSHVHLCVTEAATNSIHHGYMGKAGRAIRIDITLLDEKLIIDVCHQGNNSEQFQQALDALVISNEQDLEAFMMKNLMSEGGRGLALIKYYMDETKVLSESGWVCLSMAKHLTQ